MTSTLSEHTVLPEEVADLTPLADDLAGDASGARLISPAGRELVLPPEMYEVVRYMITALARGLAVSVVPLHTALTTQQAARLLGLSRPTLIRLLDEGHIPYTKPGRHRRVALRDVLDYRERSRHERSRALDDMVADAEDIGLYDMVETPRRTR